MTGWWSRRFDSRFYVLLVRLVGVLWFLFVAILYMHRCIETIGWMHVHPATVATWAGALSGACMFVFCLSLSWLMWVRAKPRDRAAGILPGGIAFAATYLPWLLPLFPRSRVSPALAEISALAALFASGMLIVSVLYLGRSFSIVPQARGLVTSGPYAIVRHPLYLAEEVAIAGVFLQYASPLLLPLVLLHVTLQIQRIRYEEGVLGRVFPEYGSYAKRTARLLPGIW